MKKLIAILVIVGISGFSMASSGHLMGEGLKKVDKEEEVVGISFFHGTWEEALKKADKEKKVIFLDAYAAWCGPCKLMAKNTFTNEKVGTYFNENFINVKMDMEKSEEGPRLSRKYKLTAYPTLYFIDKNEEIVYQTLGYHKPKELIEVGGIALEK